MKALIWRIFASKRKQCCKCKKTFYKPFKGAVTYKLGFDAFSIDKVGCPHCHNGNFIQV